MKHRMLIATLAAALVATVATAAPAQAGEKVVSAIDDVGDVTMLDPGSLTLAQRQSIDVQKLAVIVGADSTRFVVRLKQVLPKAKFDQMVFVTLKSSGVKPARRTDIGMTAQNRTKASSFAYYTPDTTGEDIVNCDPLVAKVRAKQRLVFLDVPHTCIPEGDVKIRLTSATGTFRSEGGGYSRDKLNPAGTYVLR